jgi:hypothetical protein
MQASLSSFDLLKMPFKKAESRFKPGILAFRTITTMLSLIHCPTETTHIEFVNIPKRKQKGLRVLDALAALLIREHEKVAIMTKPYDGKSIQVVSVVNFNNTPSAVAVKGSSRTIRWFASLNSRYTEPLFPESEEDAMKVVDPDTRVNQTLSELKNNPEALLKTFILTQWLVF